MINSYILKINGKVEIPEELVAGHNYKVSIEGSIPSYEMSDNENGTFDLTYKLKPIRVELINELGVTLKAKDPRSNSNKARSQAMAIHMEKCTNIDFETFYDAISAIQRGMANDIADQLIRQNNW
jgi:hypothetical protein